MKRTVTVTARETKGKYVDPEYFDSKQTRLKPLKAGQSQFYVSYGGKKHPVGPDPLLAWTRKRGGKKSTGTLKPASFPRLRPRGSSDGGCQFSSPRDLSG